MTSTTEYMLYSDTQKFLPEGLKSHAGFEIYKLAINPTLLAAADLIAQKHQLKKVLHKNLELSEITSTNIIAAENIGLRIDFKRLNQKNRQAIHNSIELRSHAEQLIERLAHLQQEIVDAANDASQKITNDLAACVKKNLRLPQAQLDPIFLCTHIDDLQRYLQQQGLTIETFCEITKIPKTSLMSLEEHGRYLCTALIMAAVIAKNGPLEHYDLSKTRTAKIKIKKDGEPVLPCMAYYDKAMATFNARLDAITQELQHHTIKKTENALRAINQNLAAINQQVAPQVERYNVEASYEASAKAMGQDHHASFAGHEGMLNANNETSYTSSQNLKPT